MIYNNPLNSSFNNRKVFTLNGCQLVYFIPVDELISYTKANDKIQSFILDGSRFNLFDNLDEIKYSVKTEVSRIDTLYAVELSFKIQKIDVIASNILQQLQNDKQSAIILDNNNNYRLLGFRQGLTVSYEQSSEDNVYTVTLATKQLTEPEFVDTVAIVNLPVNSSIEPITTTPDNILVPDYSNSSNGNILQTISISSDNYQISNAEHIVIANSAYTIILPDSPQNGQEHIFKAVYDASINPVIIKSSNSLIDGNADVRINTEYGSISLFYNSGKWLVTVAN